MTTTHEQTRDLLESVDSGLRALLHERGGLDDPADLYDLAIALSSHVHLLRAVVTVWARVAGRLATDQSLRLDDLGPRLDPSTTAYDVASHLVRASQHAYDLATTIDDAATALSRLYVDPHGERDTGEETR